jgi:DNA mismatch repair protein MutS2
MIKTGESLKVKETKAAAEGDKMEEINAKLKTKLVSYQELFDHNQRMILLGNKVNDIAERFFENNKKRPLISELLRTIESENSKRKRKSSAIFKKERELKKQLDESVKKELVVVRKEKKKEKKKKAAPTPPKIKLKVGDSVRMFDGRSVGTIDSIEKQKAIVNYGIFTTQVSLDLLELVEVGK